MDNLKVQCNKCKKFFEVDNKSGVYKCPHCESAKEVFVYHEALEVEDINTVVEVSKDLTRILKKHGFDYGSITTMEIAEKLYLEELCLIEDINL